MMSARRAPAARSEESSCAAALAAAEMLSSDAAAHAHESGSGSQNYRQEGAAHAMTDTAEAFNEFCSAVT